MSESDQRLGKRITRAEALRISRKTLERAERERDCYAAGDGGTHWLSGCECQERRHALLEAEHVAARRYVNASAAAREHPTGDNYQHVADASRDLEAAVHAVKDAR